MAFLGESDPNFPWEDFTAVTSKNNNTSTHVLRFVCFDIRIDEEDEINVPMALSVFRDGDRSPRSGGGMGPT